MKHVFLTLSLVTVAASAGCLWLGYRFVENEFPNPGIVKTQYPVVIFRKEDPARPTVKLVKSRPANWVSLSEISKDAINAVVISEDWAFFQHKGYDPNQIREAIKEDWEEGGFVRGASTITQQVVRNVFLSKDKKLWRKLKELFLSVQIEGKVSKRRILEIYLNIAEWGPGFYGIGAASRYYFQKPPSQLTPKEGAFLAMLLPSPVRYGQSFRSKRLTRYASRTIESILDKLVRARHLTEEQRDRELGIPLSFEAKPEPSPELTSEGAEEESGSEPPRPTEPHLPN